MHIAFAQLPEPSGTVIVVPCRDLEEAILTFGSTRIVSLLPSFFQPKTKMLVGQRKDERKVNSRMFTCGLRRKRECRVKNKVLANIL